ncbi:MAG: hypothetical protein ACLFVP_07165 [Candidatus Bathyarchaeia archaeon]
MIEKSKPPESLAKTLRMLSTMNQTKAYLYWSSDWVEKEGGEGGQVKTIEDAIACETACSSRCFYA